MRSDLRHVAVQVLIAAAVVTLPAGICAQTLRARPNDPVASVGDNRITWSELEAQVGNKLLALRSQEYNIRRRVLEDMIADRLFEREARARNINRDTLFEREVVAKTKPVTDEEVQAVVDATRGRATAGVDPGEVRESIRRSMATARQEQRRLRFVEMLKERVGVAMLMQPPRISVAAERRPSVGPATAPVTIVEFSDFQCPFCARAVATIKELRKQYGPKIRFVFRNLPIPTHPDAFLAAQAALCANDQGRFWAMHDVFFAHQHSLKASDLSTYASQLSLDVDAFKTCLSSGKYAHDVQADRAAAQSYGVSGTPAFFVNGRLISGAVPLDQFTRVVDEELSTARVNAFEGTGSKRQ